MYLSSLLEHRVQHGIRESDTLIGSIEAFHFGSFGELLGDVNTSWWIVRGARLGKRKRIAGFGDRCSGNPVGDPDLQKCPVNTDLWISDPAIQID